MSDLVSSLYPDWKTIYRSFDVYTTRFNTQTYEENRRYKLRGREEDDDESINWEHTALYGSMTLMPINAPTNKYLIVLDMNNTTNRIMGMGLVKNLLAKNQRLRIHENPCFNEYTYKSNFYVSFEHLDKEKQDYIHEHFERVLFYGKGHLKRGCGFMRFPLKRLTYSDLKFLVHLFALYDPNKFTETILMKKKH